MTQSREVIICEHCGKTEARLFCRECDKEICNFNERKAWLIGFPSKRGEYPQSSVEFCSRECAAEYFTKWVEGRVEP